MKVKDFIEEMNSIREDHKDTHGIDPYECEMFLDITQKECGFLKFETFNESIVNFIIEKKEEEND